MGFAPSKLDSSLFIRLSRTELISLFVYVDDLVIVGADLGEIGHVKSQLATSFDMKGAEVTAKPNQMKNSISRRLKKPRMDMGVTTEWKSRSQSNKGEMKPRRTRRPRPRHGLMWLRASRQKTNRRHLIWTKEETNWRQPIRFECSIRRCRIN